MIYELTNWMQIQSGLNFGTQLFPIDWNEDANDVCSRIVPTSGPASPNAWNRWVQGIEIWTRGAVQADAMEQAYQLFNVMRQKGRVDLPELQTGNRYYVLTITSPGVPEFVDFDKAGRALIMSAHRLDMQSDLASGNLIEA